MHNPRVPQYLLHIIKCESSKDCQPTIEPNPLTPHQRPRRCGGKHQGRETGYRDDGHAGQERAAEVEVFFLLGGRADEGDTTHHGDGVEACAGEERGLHEEEGAEEGGLGEVEGGPEPVFHDVAR